MNSKTDAVNTRLDSVKLVAAIAIVVAAIAAFYIYPDQSQLLRVGGLVAAVVISALIGMQTTKGRQIWEFVQQAQVEVRKVVWPTREETVQTTLIVILMVIFIAIFLWLLDMFLGWSIGSLMGRGG
ncbi:MAG TPA: preprotein translocase subunit SecE [Gammaproteobacteria bacterium]|nr:preprotein translocase subunit SecE [Gammaproteobacteria bacterium]